MRCNNCGDQMEFNVVEQKWVCKCGNSYMKGERGEY